MKINEDKSINQQINKCLRTSTWINIAMNILRENSSHTWPVVCQYPSWYSPWPLKDQFPNIFAPCPCPRPWEDPSSGGLEQHYRWEPWGHSYLRHSFGRWSHKWLRNIYFPLFVGLRPMSIGIGTGCDLSGTKVLKEHRPNQCCDTCLFRNKFVF